MDTLKMQHEHCVYEISMFMKFLSIWCEKAFQRFANFSPIIPVLVSVFSLLVLPVPTLNFSIQVEEKKSPVKMKKLEYSRNQSWKKVKALCILVYNKFIFTLIKQGRHIYCHRWRFNL